MTAISRGTDPGPTAEQPTPVPGQGSYGEVRIVDKPPTS